MSGNMCSAEIRYTCTARLHTDCEYKESSDKKWCIHGKSTYDVRFCMNEEAGKEALKKELGL